MNNKQLRIHLNNSSSDYHAKTNMRQNCALMLVYIE